MALPLWARWVATITVAAAIVLAVVLAVHGSGDELGSPQSEAQGEAEASRISEDTIASDQAPHTAALPNAGALASALERAITADVHSRIAHGQLTGPLRSVRCTQTGAARAGRVPLHCTVRSAGIDYPFLGVADKLTRRLTWCKVDLPPTAGAPLEVPLSKRCQA